MVVPLPGALRFLVCESFTEKEDVPGMGSFGVEVAETVGGTTLLLTAALEVPLRPWLPLEIFLCMGCEAGGAAVCEALPVYSKSISLSLSSA